jgi:hypothetical protein
MPVGNLQVNVPLNPSSYDRASQVQHFYIKNGRMVTLNPIRLKPSNSKIMNVPFSA